MRDKENTRNPESRESVSLEGYAGVRDSTLRDILYVLFRNKWKIVSVFCLVVAAAVVYTATATEIFQSEAELLIGLGRTSTVDPTVSVNQQIVPSARSVREDINSEVAILQSERLAQLVVDEIGAERVLTGVAGGGEGGGAAGAEASALRRALGAAKGSLGGIKRALGGGGGRAISERDLAVQAFRNGLEVIPRRDSNNIYLTMVAPDPKLAQDALDAALKHYLDIHIDVHVAHAPPEYFRQRTSELAEKLTVAEEDLKNFKEAHGITDLQQQKSLLLTQNSDARVKLSEARSAVAGASARVQYLEAQLKEAGPERIVVATTSRSNPLVEQWKRDLSELEKDLPRLRRIYREGQNTPLDEALEKINLLKARLDQESATNTESTTAVNTRRQEIVASLQRERAGLLEAQANLSELEANLATTRAELDRITPLEPQLAQREREVEVLRVQYMVQVQNQQRSEESFAQDMAKVSNVSIVQAATRPLEPIRPRKKLNLLLGMMLGAFAGVAFAFFMEYLNQSIQTAEDVEKHLGLPVLASVSDKEFRKCI